MWWPHCCWRPSCVEWFTASRSLSQDMVSSLLTKVSLYLSNQHLIESAQCTHAGLLPGQNLRSLDALHLAAATDLGVDALVTYDQRLQSAAHEIGMPVVAPS